MQALASKVLGKLNFNLEQVQDLTPTPMTLSSVMFYMGENPYTGDKVYVARSQDDKRKQKAYFFGGKLPEANGPHKGQSHRGQATKGQQFKGERRGDASRRLAKRR
jgi:radical SAM superfamily enzyme YgiQ (UPF0313 family)